MTNIINVTTVHIVNFIIITNILDIVMILLNQVVSWSRLTGTNASYLATGTVVMVQDSRVSLGNLDHLFNNHRHRID